MNESWHTYVSHTNEAAWVMSHMNKLWHTYERRSLIEALPFVSHMAGMTRLHECHDSSYVTWLIHRWQDSFVCVHSLDCGPHLYDACVVWLIRMCAMTHSYVCHDSFICEPWLIHIWTDSFLCGPPFYDACEWQDSFKYVPWRIHVCGKTHLYEKGLICIVL